MDGWVWLLMGFIVGGFGGYVAGYFHKLDEWNSVYNFDAGKRERL